MSADDIYGSVLDGMDNLTEAAALSVIRRYIPYIFGKDAQILAADDFGLPAFNPDFIVKTAENEFAIIELRRQVPNTPSRLEAVANQLLSYSKALNEAYPTAKIIRVLIVIGALSVAIIDRLMGLGVNRIYGTDDLRRLLQSHGIPPEIAESALQVAV